MYRGLAKKLAGSRLPTWDELQELETKALLEGAKRSGATLSPDQAGDVVRRAIDDLKSKGVSIQNIPWGG